MDLKLRVAAHLRTGSVNTPGQDAINILASRLHCKKNDVKEALRELMAEGNLDLGGGTLQHTTYIGISRVDFRPRTENGRKEGKYAVDQVGNHYRGIATGGPLTVRHLTFEEWIARGEDPAKYPLGTPASQIQVQEATIMDASVPKPADAVSDEAQAQAAAPVVDAVNAELAKPSGDQPKRKKKTAPRVETVPQRRRIENIEKLKQLITEHAANAEGGLVSTSNFKSSAAKILCVGEAAIDAYLTDLVKAKFIERAKTEWQGKANIRLVVKQSSQEKLSAALEVLRTLKRKRSRKSLTDELAVALRITPKSAQTSVLTYLRVINAYEVKQVGNDFNLMYVQDGPVTDEQMEKIRLWRREHKGKQPEQVDTETAPQATTELDLPMQQPYVVLNESEPDEITQLITELVDTNEAQAAELARLNAANASLDQHLAAEVDRLTSVNNLLEQQLIEALEKRDFYHVLAEAERTRPIVVTPAKPTLPEDLLQRARAALVSQVRNHLRPPAEGDDIV